MPPPRLHATFASPAEFLAAFDGEVTRGGLLVRGAEAGAAAAMSPCRLAVEVAGAPPVEVDGRIAAAVPGLGVAVIFEGLPPPLAALAASLRAPAAPGPAEAAPHRSLADRLRAMSIAQKMQLALCGGRDERLALLRDGATPAHLYVLRNPRLGLDEVQAAARSATLAPDALRFIAEHRDWSANPGVCTALVRNPKTPLPLALDALRRVPASELRAIAKGGARDQLVQAARRLLLG